MSTTTETRTNYHRLAIELEPHAAWVLGDGPWASVARCGIPTVQLFRTEPEARSAQAFIDRYGCTGECHRDQQVIRLEATP